MNPVALDEASVPQEVKDEELKVAIEKTKEEQVKKAVEAAIKKAGYNAYIAESEEHLEEGIRKGNITEEDAAAIRELKESCLLNQEYIQDSKQTVAEYLKSTDKDLTVTAFKRFTLRAE